ncbi:uncharacterized protein PFL1_00823 [Pseudozyma flocculosa PF-1]|uniref:Related to dihydroflavonol reductase n=1 Tax=Pseudozyma flocculosa TaxID=84751 RepID=A0A5C3F417_9BASI|nr:uncharacterized protein PFL1_00823 [Pseudozyma flocculosa PF-1]EPQ31488.1 hypothetical protein PFL1_00823 [Pseudozyma flocculosa PF-1]SPO38725.1 related to dihydroflavonol reductase [Pseudozyma flocculosa]
MSSSPLVLITGVTGFLAAHVLDSVLASPHNYRVRGTLRSLSKRDALLARLAPKDRDRIELVEVADTATSDLLDAVRGVDYILHVASPYQLNVEDAERDLLIPAVEGTLNLLRFAKKQGGVKRVVVTSSFAAVTNFEEGGPNRPGFTYTASDWNPSTYEDALKAGGAGAFSYSVSKKLAEQAAYDYVAAERPSFALATVNPPMIYGPTLQPGVTKQNLNTSSRTIYNLVSGADAMPEDRLPLFCHARDVADAHTLLLEGPDDVMGKRYLVCGGKFTWAHAVLHISERFPDLRGRLPKGWEEATKQLRNLDQIASLDTAPAERDLGIKFKDWKTTLDESIESLLQLEKEQGW